MIYTQEFDYKYYCDNLHLWETYVSHLAETPSVVWPDVD